MNTKHVLALVTSATVGLLCGVACDVEEDGLHERGSDKEYCTLTQGYWKTHNAYAKQPKKQIAWPFSEDFSNGCNGGQGFLDALHTPPQGSPYYILLHQYIAAKLNVLSGLGWTHAGESEAWGQIQDANAILSDCTVSVDEFEYAMELSESLDAFNNGVWGPGHCDDK